MLTVLLLVLLLVGLIVLGIVLLNRAKRRDQKARDFLAKVLDGDGIAVVELAFQGRSRHDQRWHWRLVVRDALSPESQPVQIRMATTMVVAGVTPAESILGLAEEIRKEIRAQRQESFAAEMSKPAPFSGS